MNVSAGRQHAFGHQLILTLFGAYREGVGLLLMLLTETIVT